jgi:hypothetical protein
MFGSDEEALLTEYWPLYEAEWHRLGISRADQQWIHAGSEEQPTREKLETGLQALRELPTGMGVVAYCAHLGFAYATVKRDLGIDPDHAT